MFMNIFKVLLFQLKSDILILKYEIAFLRKILLNYFLDGNKCVRR